MIHAETLAFLTSLKENNHKDWFDDHRKAYDAAKANALEFTSRLLEKMAVADPGLEMLTPKDCMFRINRDVRFSADKSPYKTHMGIVLTQGGKKSGLASYYVHIEPGIAFVGGGVWMPMPEALTRIRKEIHYFYDEWKAIITEKAFLKYYGSLDVEDGSMLKKCPKGFEADDPAIEFLKLKSFTATMAVSDAHLTRPDVIEEITQAFIALKPMIDFLSRGLMTGSEAYA
jgi:uncharacterized protein (TIGR02453 family)